MLFVPEQSTIYRYCAIDPGSNTLGLSIFDVDLMTMQLTINEAVTYSGEKLSNRYPYVNEVHGDKLGRLIAHEENLKEILYQWQPHGFICESPFLGRFPQAFAALTETMSMIRRVVYLYNPSICVETIDPPTAKKAVGVIGNSRDKEDVRQAVLKLPSKGVHFNLDRDISLLDEHAIDAIAVGFYKYNQIVQWFQHNSRGIDLCSAR